jgi:hypothetical protein
MMAIMVSPSSVLSAASFRLTIFKRAKSALVILKTSAPSTFHFMAQHAAGP